MEHSSDKYIFRNTYEIRWAFSNIYLRKFKSDNQIYLLTEALMSTSKLNTNGNILAYLKLDIIIFSNKISNLDRWLSLWRPRNPWHILSWCYVVRPFPGSLLRCRWEMVKGQNSRMQMRLALIAQHLSCISRPNTENFGVTYED